ncbi:hypothetical protein SGRIM119S_07121 [Streptomyces griseorubiginosus]
MPPEGLRTQIIAATGSGKTLIAAESAQRLSARRVLVLVPTLDLLTQMAGAWRRAGRSGAMIGVCSLRAEESQGLPCTTDPEELVEWLRGLETVTVFADLRLGWHGGSSAGACGWPGGVEPDDH